MENWTAKRQLSFWLVILFVFGCSSWAHSKRSAVRAHRDWTIPAFNQTSRVCDLPSRCYANGACGNSPLYPLAQWRIVNGVDQQYGEFPSFVSVLKGEDGHRCGGVLVSDQHVLTAAHCMYDNSTGVFRRVRPSELRILLAPHYTTFGLSYMEILHNVEDICIADTYSHMNSDYDWAVVTLSVPVQFNTHVQPACLPYYSQKWYHEDNSYCFVMGLGGNKVLQPPDYLGTNPRVVQKMRVTQVACTFHHSDVARFCWTKVGSEGDTCYGDSGGPILCYMKRLNRWTAVGLVSSGSTNCNFTPTTSYVRLPLIYEQIERQCGLFRTSTPGCLLRAEAS